MLSGKTVEELKFLPVQRMPAARLAPAGKVEAMPAKLAPMLAEIGDAPFHRADWMWEPKLDGYRVLAFIDEHGVKLRSRRGLELSPQVPAARGGARASRRSNGMILDGEIVAFDADGKPSFAALQDRAQLKTEREIAAADKTLPVVFFCFDLLHFAGIDLRKSPYRRSPALPRAVPAAVAAACSSCTRTTTASRCSAAALASGFEGVVGKRKDSRYEAGRRSHVVAQGQADAERGFRRRRLHQGQGRARAAGRAAGRLLGRATRQAALRVARRLGLRRARAEAGQGAAGAAAAQDLPVRREPELNGPTTWVEPEAVAEVSFQSWTEDGHLRAPVFLRLRDDVDPKAVRRADAGRRARPRPSGGPDRRRRGAAREHEDGVHARGGRCTGSASRTSIASTGRPIRRKTSRRSPSAICCAISRRSRPTCCRTSPTGR